MFYPGSPAELAREVAALLAAVRITDDRRPKALIVPHAGYVYSGPIAARAFAQIAPFAAEIERVVIVGPAHREYVEGLAWPDAAALATPLGEVAVDTGAIAQLQPADDTPSRDLPPILGHARAHAREHCVEVMLPFLQHLMPHAKVVPLIGSRATPAQMARVLEALWGGPETLIVISSDLSHHLPYATAQARDRETARRILALDDTLVGDDACGALAIDGLTHLAREHGLVAVQLDLRNSGDTAGSRDRVVGYGAFAFYEAA